MKKYFNIDLYTGRMDQVSEEDFNEMIIGCENVNINTKDGVTTYKFEEDIIVEMTV